MTHVREAEEIKKQGQPECGTEVCGYVSSWALHSQKQKSRNEHNHIQFKLVPLTISCRVTDVEMYLFTFTTQRPR